MDGLQDYVVLLVLRELIEPAVILELHYAEPEPLVVEVHVGSLASVHQGSDAGLLLPLMILSLVSSFVAVFTAIHSPLVLLVSEIHY